MSWQGLRQSDGRGEGFPSGAEASPQDLWLIWVIATRLSLYTHTTAPSLCTAYRRAVGLPASPPYFSTHTPLRPFLPPPYSPCLLAPLAGLRAGGAAAGHEAERTYSPPPPHPHHHHTPCYGQKSPPPPSQERQPGGLFHSRFEPGASRGKQLGGRFSPFRPLASLPPFPRSNRQARRRSFAPFLNRCVVTVVCA